MKSVARDIATTFSAIIIIIVVSVYGGNASIEHAVRQAVTLVRETVTGRYLTQNYWSVAGFEIINSMQLIGLALAFAVLLGILLVILSIGLQRGVIRKVADGIVTVLESVPDTMYVIISVAGFLILLEDFNINLPLFGGSLHPTFADTVIPALSIAIPAALQIRRLVMERLDEEVKGQYVTTAVSKGNSLQRAFFRHVLPNVGSAFFYSFVTATSVILAALLFCTFFFQYHDLFFKFSQAIGWNQRTGYRFTGHYMGIIPGYQPGTVALIGTLLVVIWLIVKVFANTLSRRLFPQEREVTSTFVWYPIRKFWVITGIAMLTLLLFFGTFPSLLTSHTPQQMVYGQASQPFPLPPSHATPMGTDDVGHDLFSIMLYCTWGTLLRTTGITLIVTLGSFGIGLLGVVMEGRQGRGWLSNVILGVNRVLSSLPGFFVLFLILYPRNQAVANAWQHHTHSLAIWRQTMTYIFWLCIFEMGRGSYSFYEAMREWRQFSFMEGVHSIGKSHTRAFVTNLRPWVIRFGLSFAFGELSRVLSLMTQLAAFSLFLAVKVGYLQFVFTPHSIKGLIAAQSNWISVLGAIINQYTFISYPYLLYGPLLFILLAMLGSNFIARGIRGGSL